VGTLIGWAVLLLLPTKLRADEGLHDG